MSDIPSKTLKKLLGDAGAGIDKSNGQDALYDVLKALQDEARNKVMEGLSGAAPTTASTQATGAGTLAARANFSAGMCLVDGTQKRFAAQADFVLFNAATPVVALSSIIFSVVAFKNAAGVIAFAAAPGTPWVTATGTPVAATRAQIQAVVGFDTKGNPLHWTKVCDVTVNRTADTTVTQTQDDTAGDFGAQGVVIE